MSSYRVIAVMETELYLDVEADSMEEAMQIGHDTDGGDFKQFDGMGTGDWRVVDAIQID